MVMRRAVILAAVLTLATGVAFGQFGDENLIITFQGAVFPPPPSSFTPVTGGVTLTGNFVQIGITPGGHLVYNDPVIGTAIGFRFDATGAADFPNPQTKSYDVIRPGCYCEGWGIRADTPTGAIAGSQYGAGGGLPVAPVASFGTATVGTIKFARSVATVGPLEITHVFSLGQNDRYVAITVTIRNTGTTPVTNIRYVRTADFDIDAAAGGSFSTDKHNTLNELGHPEILRAVGTIQYLIAHGLGSKSPFAVGDSITFATPDPDVFTTSRDANDTLGDFSETFRYNIALIAPGATSDPIQYAYLVGSEDVPLGGPPVAVDDSYSVDQDTVLTVPRPGVLANDTDAEGDPLTAVLVSNAANGFVILNSDGSFSYTPSPGFSGTDSFTYQASDGSLSSNIATVTITVVATVRCPIVDLVSPANNATNVPTSGVFQFESSGRSFELFYGPVGQGCSTLRGVHTTRSIPYSGLQPDTEYEWRVDTQVPGCHVSSDCNRFRTERTCHVAPPTPLSPTAGATLASPVTFTWTPVAGATGYTVFASTGAPADTNLGSTAATSLVASVPDAATSWYVVARSVPGCGDLRSVSTGFKICNAPEAPLASVVGESTSGQTYEVAWGEVDGASRYEVIEATNASFTDARTFTTEGLSLSFTKNTDRAVPFFYQVLAFSDCFNGSGPGSPTIRVVVVPVPPHTDLETRANIPFGSDRPVVLRVFIPGQGGETSRFEARTDQEWMTVRPSSGILPPEGVTLEVVADPRGLNNGTFTGTVIVTVSDLTAGRLTTHANTTVSVPVTINLVTPVFPVGAGPPTADSLIIPAVGHLDGSDAKWRSDVRIANITNAPARYLVMFTPGNPALGVKRTSLDVAPGETTALDDIVRAWYGIGSLGESSNGVLEVRPASTIANLTVHGLPNVSLATVISSRTYALTANGTLGGFIPGIPFVRFVGLAEPGALQPILNLQQIAQNQAYRTNIGVVEASGHPVSTLLRIFNSAGDKLRDIQVDLKANEQRQLNSLLAEHGITLSDGRVEVAVIGGQGKVTAYAAVVDNRTKDHLFVPATRLGEITSSKYVMPGIADLNTGLAVWRSDVRLFNSGSTPQNATLTLYPQNSSGAPIRADVTVAPGQVAVLDNVIRTLFGASNIGGALHVDTPAASQLVATARTYNQTQNGTLGLFIPAVTPDEAVGANGRALNIVQAEDSVRYRTNVGIAEVTGNPVTVEILVHLPNSKVAPRIEIPLAGNEFRQLGILRQLGIGNIYNARISMRVINGAGSITAYGSVIDMKTNDSTYVPAQ